MEYGESWWRLGDEGPEREELTARRVNGAKS